MEKLSVSQKLGPQIDALILKGIDRESCLAMIEEYRAAKADMGLPMAASAKQHYESRPNHLKADGSISCMKPEGSGKGSGTKAPTWDNDRMEAFGKDVITLLRAPLSGPSDLRRADSFPFAYAALAALEAEGLLSFVEAALAAKEAEKKALEAAKEAEKLEAAMALCRAAGIKMEAPPENITMRNYRAFAASLPM